MRSAPARRSRRRASAIAALLAFAHAAGLASRAFAADASASDDERTRALATDLFDRGVSLMEKGRCDAAPVGDASACAEACDAFRRAFDLYPAGLGALRNLAYVEKALGRTASAARDFRELARRAPLDPRPARRLWAEFARTELVALEPRVPHLLVQLPNPLPMRTSVSLDGKAMPPETWGAAMPLDPGPHAVHVESDGYVAFDESLTIAEAESRTVVVRLAPRVVERPIDAPPRAGAARTWALGTTAVGAALVVVGLGYGAAALAKQNAVCDDRYCDPAGYDRVRAWTRTSTIVTGVGLAVGVGGLAWYLLLPKSRESRATIVAPYATLDGAGLVLVRRF